jgi:hypothetical protein
VPRRTAGADAASEEHPQASLAMNMVYVAGLFTFAVLLGIVTDDIGSAVQNVRSVSGALPPPAAARAGSRRQLACPGQAADWTGLCLQGNYAIAESKHTVVVGWNSQAIHVLRQVGGLEGGRRVGQAMQLTAGPDAVCNVASDVPAPPCALPLLDVHALNTRRCRLVCCA